MCDQVKLELDQPLTWRQSRSSLPRPAGLFIGKRGMSEASTVLEVCAFIL